MQTETGCFIHIIVKCTSYIYFKLQFMSNTEQNKIRAGNKHGMSENYVCKCGWAIERSSGQWPPVQNTQALKLKEIVNM